MHRARRAPAGIRADPVGPPVGDELDVAVEIGAEHGDAGSGGECRQGLGRRMPVLVALADGDDGHGRARRVQRTPGVVDEVEPWCPTFSTSTAGSSPRSISIASTGASASPVSRAANPPSRDDHDHRSVVDVALRQGRRGIGIGRVEDLD